jgi:hypothetical protein
MFAGIFYKEEGWVDLYHRTYLLVPRVRRKLEQIYTRCWSRKTVQHLIWHILWPSSAYNRSNCTLKHNCSPRLYVISTFYAHLWMQNCGSKYLKPNNGPREHPVTNLHQYSNPISPLCSSQRAFYLMTLVSYSKCLGPYLGNAQLMNWKTEIPWDQMLLPNIGKTK